MIKFSRLRVRMLAGLLVVLALLAVAGAATGRPVWDDLWKELFWLVLGVALVTFLVEGLLSNAQAFELARRQASTIDAELSQLGLALLAVFGVRTGSVAPISAGPGRRQALRQLRQAVDHAATSSVGVDVKALRTARPTLLVSINIIGVSIANFLVRDQTQASRYFHGWSAVHQRLFALDLDEVDDAVVDRSPDTTSQPELVDLVDAAVNTFQEMVDLVDVDDLPWALALDNSR
jgi:hypothetical protein